MANLFLFVPVEEPYSILAKGAKSGLEISK
jgi:hypothetical protein